jgi:hypothetical protein
MLTIYYRGSALGEGVLILEKAVSRPKEYVLSNSYFLASFTNLHHSPIKGPSPFNSIVHGDEDHLSKKRRLDTVSPAAAASLSPRDTHSIVLTPEESTHHAEQARSVIQGELDGNHWMDRERQSILRSALEFVSSMMQARASNPHEFVPEVPRDHQDTNVFISPSPELLYMLLQGNNIPFFYGLY